MAAIFFDSSENVLADLPAVFTLQGICLNSICENIDRFNDAFQIVRFNPPEDCILKKLLLFLQLKYSNAIIDMLTQENKISLDKKYFDLLINKDLTVLTWSMFRVEDLCLVLEMLPTLENTLKDVTFEFAVQDSDQAIDFKQFVIQVLPHLRNVEGIRIFDSYCDDTTLAVMHSACKELKELCLARCPITDRGLKSLCPEDTKNEGLHLHSLRLEGIHNCDEGVSYLLKKVRSLKSIYYANLATVLYMLHGNDLRNDTLDDIPKYNLESLLLYEGIPVHPITQHLKEALMIASKLCPCVSKIDIQCIKSKEQLQILYQFPGLTEIHISGETLKGEYGDKDLDVSDFFQHCGEKVKVLELSWFKLNLNTLIENCPNLETLHLRSNDYYISKSSENINILKNMKSLTFEFLLHVNKTNEIVSNQFLDCCPNLVELQFADSFVCENQTGDIIQRYCEKSEMLERLAFVDGFIEFSLLKSIILTCTPLKKLVVKCRNIGIKSKKKLRNLKKPIGVVKQSI